MSETEEKYDDLGGVYFPILQQDGSRVLMRINKGRSPSDLLFLAYLRQHDRKQAGDKP